MRHMIMLLSCFLIIRVARRRWLSRNVHRHWAHSWVSVLQSLGARFVLPNHRSSRRVKNFIGDVFSEGSVHLPRETPGGATNWLLGIFGAHHSGSFRLVEAAVEFGVAHHIHASCLHVHVRQLEVAGPHSNHGTWVASLGVDAVQAFVNGLLVLAWAASRQESFKERFLRNTI